MLKRRDVFSRRGHHVFCWNIGILAFIVAVIGVYVAFDNGRVVIKTQKVLVADLPKDLEGFTILHISDLNGKQFGPKQKHIGDALKNKRYNAVCITGDMVGKKGDYYPFFELLSALDTTKPVFFIAGNMDPTPVGARGVGYHTVLADWITSIQARGAVYLDAPASMKIGNSTVWFMNASQYSLDLTTAAAAYAAATTPEGTYYADAIARTIAAQKSMKETDLHIGLSHIPFQNDTVQILKTDDPDEDSFLRSADLVLAGDTVGGQWRLPFLGPVYANGWFPDETIVSGYHYTGSNRSLQYISGGLGTSGTNPLPGFRLFNTPEMTLITFTSILDLDTLP